MTAKLHFDIVMKWYLSNSIKEVKSKNSPLVILNIWKVLIIYFKFDISIIIGFI